MVSNPARLHCVGLGSCAAIILHDRIHRLGGLAHAMLPRYEEGHDKARPGKYVDTAIYLMVEELLEMGAARQGIVAKVVGGAQMFSTVASDFLDIGARNIASSRQILKKEGIRIIAEDVGGKQGRSLVFDVRTGGVLVTTGRESTRSI